jgi:hypothetical protein
MMLAMKARNATRTAVPASADPDAPQLARLIAAAITEVKLSKSPVVATASDAGSWATTERSTIEGLLVTRQPGEQEVAQTVDE